MTASAERHDHDTPNKQVNPGASTRAAKFGRGVLHMADRARPLASQIARGTLSAYAAAMLGIGINYVYQKRERVQDVLEIMQEGPIMVPLNREPAGLPGIDTVPFMRPEYSSPTPQRSIKSGQHE